jgi:hypothetical protein
MGQAIPKENYDPETLKMLGRAFDAAWQDIRGGLSDAAVEDRRIRLALIILELARNGRRREQEIKASALNIMRRSQMPVVVGLERMRANPQ